MYLIILLLIETGLNVIVSNNMDINKYTFSPRLWFKLINFRNETTKTHYKVGMSEKKKAKSVSYVHMGKVFQQGLRECVECKCENKLHLWLTINCYYFEWISMGSSIFFCHNEHIFKAVIFFSLLILFFVLKVLMKGLVFISPILLTQILS